MEKQENKTTEVKPIQGKTADTSRIMLNLKNIIDSIPLKKNDYDRMVKDLFFLSDMAHKGAGVKDEEPSEKAETSDSNADKK